MEEFKVAARSRSMADSDQPNHPRRRPFALTFFGLIAIGGLIAMPLLAGPPGEQELPDIIRFFGRFHPVLLHLPIGVFTLILLQELGAIFGGRERENGTSGLFPMFFGAASAIVAVIAGFLLYHGHADDYGGDALAERHLWGGLIFAVAAVFTFIVKAWTVALVANPAWYRLLLFVSVGIMGFASHDGASITHGRDYLTKYAPAPIRRILRLEVKETGVQTKSPEDREVYADVIAPILERRCVSCHKEGKAKGKYRMDTYELLVKGGIEGPGIVPGKADESNILIRINLPEDDGDHMPPEGKPDIEAAEIAVLKWWLDSGADPKKKLADCEIPTEINDALKKLSTTATIAPSTPGHAAPAVGGGADDSLKAAVASLANEFPGALGFESQDSPLLTFSAVSLRGKLDDETFGKLAPVLSHLSTLDLSATKITDKSVAALASATNLRLVRFTETAITDAAVNTLLKLPNLESINLYGTKVTDAGILKLGAAPKLKHLYLWQTSVTPETIKAVQEKLPACEIITGS